ncbi:hypothetical protein MMPV_009693 [Pyropia vietnamensis]
MATPGRETHIHLYDGGGGGDHLSRRHAVVHHNWEWVLVDATERRVASVLISRYEDTAQMVHLADGPIVTVKWIRDRGDSFEARPIDDTSTGVAAAGTVAGTLSTHVQQRRSRVSDDAA